MNKLTRKYLRSIYHHFDRLEQSIGYNTIDIPFLMKSYKNNELLLKCLLSFLGVDWNSKELSYKDELDELLEENNIKLLEYNE